MCNLGIFTTLIYSSLGILRAQGILRNLTNMYDGLFSTEPCITLVFSELEAYSEPWQIYMMENFVHDLYSFNSSMFRAVAYSESRHIQNTAKHLSQNILFKILCNPDVFRNPVYSDSGIFWKQSISPTEYLRWSILSRTLCNFNRFRGPIYTKLSHIQDRCLSAIS